MNSEGLDQTANAYRMIRTFALNQMNVIVVVSTGK